MRKFQNDLKQHFFPSLILMMTTGIEFEDEIEEWYKKQDEEELQAKSDVCSVAADSLNRISSFVGEKVTLSCTTQLIKECVENKEKWQFRMAGFLSLGMISDTCSEVFLKNMDDVIRMSAIGIIDQHPRVRFEALTSLSLLLTELSPSAQVKYHQDMMPVLLRLMTEEEQIKMKTQAASCMVSFVRGLIDEPDEAGDDEEVEDIEESKTSTTLTQKQRRKVLAPY